MVTVEVTMNASPNLLKRGVREDVNCMFIGYVKRVSFRE